MSIETGDAKPTDQSYVVFKAFSAQLDAIKAAPRSDPEDRPGARSTPPRPRQGSWPVKVSTVSAASPMSRSTASNFAAVPRCTHRTWAIPRAVRQPRVALFVGEFQIVASAVLVERHPRPHHQVWLSHAFPRAATFSSTVACACASSIRPTAAYTLARERHPDRRSRNQRDAPCRSLPPLRDFSPAPASAAPCPKCAREKIRVEFQRLGDNIPPPPRSAAASSCFRRSSTAPPATADRTPAPAQAQPPLPPAVPPKTTDRARTTGARSHTPGSSSCPRRKCSSDAAIQSQSNSAAIDPSAT